MIKISEIAKRVRDAVDSGTTTVAEAHKKVSHKSFKALEQWRPVEAWARRLHEMHDGATSRLYESLRAVNHALYEAVAKTAGARARRTPRAKKHVERTA